MICCNAQIRQAIESQSIISLMSRYYNHLHLCNIYYRTREHFCTHQDTTPQAALASTKIKNQYMPPSQTKNNNRTRS